MQALCIIIPCYNEALRLQPDAFRQHLKENEGVHFCFVNDGSSDDTFNMLQAMETENPAQVKAVNVARNGGKAEAIRAGVVAAREWKTFDLLGFFDSDLSTPLEEIHHLAAEMNRSDTFQIVFGARMGLMGRRISRRALRHYLGRVFATLASMLLRMPIYDTQCGAKLFKPALCEVLFTKPFISRWFFDVEMLFRLVRGYGRDQAHAMVTECPLYTWEEKKGSKLKVFDFLKVPFQLFRIYFYYRRFDPRK